MLKSGIMDAKRGPFASSFQVLYVHKSLVKQILIEYFEASQHHISQFVSAGKDTAVKSCILWLFEVYKVFSFASIAIPGIPLKPIIAPTSQYFEEVSNIITKISVLLL